MHSVATLSPLHNGDIFNLNVHALFSGQKNVNKSHILLFNSDVITSKVGDETKTKNP